MRYLIAFGPVRLGTAQVYIGFPVMARVLVWGCPLIYSALSPDVEREEGLVTG